MIKGIGIDAVSIQKTRLLLDDPAIGYAEYTYTQEELQGSLNAPDRAAYLAGRFAVKEAVFKALAPLTENGFFDLRCVTALNRKDGSPYVSVNGELKQVMKEAGVSNIHISITTEDDLAIAFAVAEGGS